MKHILKILTITCLLTLCACAKSAEPRSDIAGDAATNEEAFPNNTYSYLSETDIPDTADKVAVGEYDNSALKPFDYGGRIWTDRQSALVPESAPYSAEFAKEISDAAMEAYKNMMTELEESASIPYGGTVSDIQIGGSDNRLYTEELETYPLADGKFFVVKPYGHVQGLDVGYFEIYLFDGGTMIGGYYGAYYTSLYCDGEYLYYVFKDKLCRISEDGRVDEIIDFEVYNPEDPDEELYPYNRITAEAEGDILTVTAGFYRGSEAAFYYKTNTYAVNVADLSVEPQIGEFNVEQR